MQRYQARVADQNAQFANQQAQDAQERTRLEAQRQYRQIGATKGQQIAAMAANGIDVNSGSALQVQQDTAMIGAEDVGNIYKAGFNEAKGFEINAANYRSQAAASRQAATNTLIGGAFDMASTALGGAKQFNRYKWNVRNSPTSNPWGGL